MRKIQELLLENKAWVKGKTDGDPDYFTRMAKDQDPEYLWIGCSDSRVPPSEITNSNPGEMFVHRNIANLVVHTDMNLLSVLQYAVLNLGVRHVIVCGHYNCGGVKAALSHANLGLIDNWVRNIKETYFTHKAEVDTLNGWEQVNKLVELNVVKQVQNLANTSIIQESWKKNQSPFIHGWVYDINTGYIKELITLTPETQVDSAFKYDF